MIDPTSVEFRPLEHADQIEVADTVFPGQKPQHLIWNIESEFEGQALVEVSYFTSVRSAKSVVDQLFAWPDHLTQPSGSNYDGAAGEPTVMLVLH